MTTDPRDELRSLLNVQNTYAEYRKNPRSYERESFLHVLYTDGTTKQYTGSYDDGTDPLYRRAVIDAKNRGAS